MFKYNYGSTTNPETNESKDVVVTLLQKSNVKDTAIGMGLILLGGLYLCVSMFKNGADASIKAEYDVLDSLNLLD